ncbi:unnamed protein product [Diamesa tonsa]
MIFIKCILLIALLNYSNGENRIKRSLKKTRQTTTIPTTTTVKTPEICRIDQICVNYQHCDNGTINIHGKYITDPRFDKVCSGVEDVCCTSPTETEEPIEKPDNNEIATKCGVLNPNGVGTQIKETVDREAQFGKVKKKDTFKDRKMNVKFIIGEFPWMIVVLKKEPMLDDISSIYHCGGSLIHPSVVLTAGTKVVGENPEELVVRAGEWDTQTTSEHLPFVESNVASLAVHENLVSSSGLNNIALLFLETPIQNDKHINTICLPQRNVNFDGARCLVTGWGKSKFGRNEKYQDIMKKIDLPVIERHRCNEMFRKTRLGPYFQLHKSLICAGGEAGKDSCKGDGGSPLVCPVPGNEGYFYQAGIVAWGIGCGENNTPGAYTNVALFADWIENKIKHKGFNSDICVNYQHCDDGTLNESGNNLVDLRPVLLCSHYLEVCCAFSNVTEIPIDIAVNNKIATKCGVSNPNGVGMKIKEIVDREAQFGEFPWMVLVLRKEVLLNDISSVYYCGGSLIHPSVILTAGHKVVEDNPKDLIVRAGEWDTRTKSEHLTTIESNVASLVVHENFFRRTGLNNIALLFLETPIQNDKHINTICLPQPNVNFDGSRCFATGWGKHDFGEGGKYQEILKKIDLPVVERHRCTEMFKNTRLGIRFQLHESLICAGGEEGIDSCTGDGGSPLVCPVPGNKGYFYQAGIVAWGIGCGGRNVPGAYTNVALFADWIENKIKQKGYNSRSYTL